MSTAALHQSAALCTLRQLYYSFSTYFNYLDLYYLTRGVVSSEICSPGSSSFHGYNLNLIAIHHDRLVIADRG